MDARAWDERYRAEPDLWGEPNPTITSYVDDRAPGTALDLGCGNGRHAAWLAGLGWRATGVDFSAAAIEQARRREVAVSWVVADALTWQPAGRFDLVVTAYLHLPLEQTSDLLRRSLGWLEPGGRLVHLSHALANLRHGVGGPQVPALLPRPGDLAGAVDAADIDGDLLVTRLQHQRRRTESGTAVDLLLVVDRLG
jgi:SAM-dependent methyltransferase